MHTKGYTIFAELSSNSVFISNVKKVNSNCSASKLCNLYPKICGDKDDIAKCMLTICIMNFGLLYAVLWC